MEQIDNIVVDVVVVALEAFSLGGGGEPSGRPPMEARRTPAAQPILQEEGEERGDRGNEIKWARGRMGCAGDWSWRW